MTTTIIIISLVIWFIGAVLMRLLMEMPTRAAEDPLAWKLMFSALWPVVVPMLFLIISVNNFLYHRRIKKLKRERK